MYIIDTTFLIEYHRRKDKSKCALTCLQRKKKRLVISSITVYEILLGCKTDEMRTYWRKELKQFEILPFDENAAAWAALIHQNLAKKSRSIAPLDLCIAATAVAHGLRLATHNWQHFEHIDELELRRF